VLLAEHLILDDPIRIGRNAARTTLRALAKRRHQSANSTWTAYDPDIALQARVSGAYTIDLAVRIAARSKMLLPEETATDEPKTAPVSDRSTRITDIPVEPWSFAIAGYSGTTE
jgi:hypothetical protein